MLTCQLTDRDLHREVGDVCFAVAATKNSASGVNNPVRVSQRSLSFHLTVIFAIAAVFGVSGRVFGIDSVAYEDQPEVVVEVETFICPQD